MATVRPSPRTALYSPMGASSRAAEATMVVTADVSAAASWSRVGGGVVFSTLANASFPLDAAHGFGVPHDGVWNGDMADSSGRCQDLTAVGGRQGEGHGQEEEEEGGRG